MTEFNEFKAGLRCGYMLAKYEFQVAGEVLDTTSEDKSANEFISGFLIGKGFYNSQQLVIQKEEINNDVINDEQQLTEQSERTADYIDGLDVGYLLTKYVPQLIKTPVTSQQLISGFYRGLIFGIRELEQWKKKKRIKIYVAL